MKSRSFLLLVILAAGLSAGCEDTLSADTAAASGVPASCAACHQGKQSLAGRNPEELADAIRAIRDGKVKHPPLGLADDSDVAVDALAEALAAK